MAFDVRKWLYDQSTDFIPSFTVRERQLFSAGARIVEGVVRVGARLMIPGAAAITSVELVSAEVAIAQSNYGVTRIGGGVHSTIGTLLVGGVLIRGASMLKDRFTISRPTDSS